MAATFIVAPVFLLIVVAVIFGLVMLGRAMPPGSGSKAALGVGVVLALVMLGLLFLRSQTTVRHAPVVVQDFPVSFDHDSPAPAAEEDWFPSVPVYAKLLSLLFGTTVLIGIMYLIYHLAQSPSGRSVLSVGGIGLGCLGLFLFIGYSTLEDRSTTVMVPPIYPETHQSARRVDPLKIPEATKPDANSSTATEPETTTVTSGANKEKSNTKPAWLSQGTQTGNGVSQFPVSSELFATVAECQKDLDRRMPGQIADEARFLVGEEYSITLLPGEAQRLVAETYTEEVTTSQGVWYKIHRLIKIDQQSWNIFRARFQQAQLNARLETLGMAFGGLMLVIGVAYLFLRRQPRLVDPTLSTFSTTS